MRFVFATTPYKRPGGVKDTMPQRHVKRNQVATAGGEVPYENDYKDGLCCLICVDCPTTCYYCCCAPCGAGTLSQKLDGVPGVPCAGSFCSACCMYAFLAYIGVSCLQVCAIRTSYNKARGINEDDCSAFCKSCLCGPVALAQIDHEVTYRQNNGFEFGASALLRPPKLHKMTL